MLTSSKNPQADLEPLSIGQSLFHPGSKEDGGESKERPGDEHEDAMGLEQLLSQLTDSNVSFISGRVELTITDRRNERHMVGETSTTCQP